MKTLHLNIKTKPFEVMFTGEKGIEIRKPSKWIESRLFDKNGKVRDYDFVKITLGYGKLKPHFVAKYNGVITAISNFKLNYSNGLSVDVEKGDYQILLGNIVKRQYEQSKSFI